MNSTSLTRAKLSILAAGLMIFSFTSPRSLAGVAVAGDGHGGYAYSYGNRSKGDLENDARARCHRVSKHDEDVRILAVTMARGANVIVRFYLPSGAQRISTCLGASSLKKARRIAIAFAEKRGAESYEIVEEWCE